MSVSFQSPYTASVGATVSVLVPTFNAESHLAETLDSVLSQEGVEVQVIVCDDASTDGTFEIALEKLERSGRSFAMKRQAVNVGVGQNLEAGLREARGEWICLFSHDDVMPRQYLADAIRQAQRHNAQVVTPDVRPFGAKGVRRPRTMRVPDIQSFAPLELHARLWSRNLLNSPGMLLHRELMSCIVPQPTEHTCGDWAVWLQITRHHKVAKSRLPIKYRILPTSISRSAPRPLFVVERNRIVNRAIHGTDLEMLDKQQCGRNSALEIGLGGVAHAVMRDPSFAGAVVGVSDLLEDFVISAHAARLLEDLDRLACFLDILSSGELQEGIPSVKAHEAGVRVAGWLASLNILSSGCAESLATHWERQRVGYGLSVLART